MAENQPPAGHRQTNQNRMNNADTLSGFAATLRDFIARSTLPHAPAVRGRGCAVPGPHPPPTFEADASPEPCNESEFTSNAGVLRSAGFPRGVTTDLEFNALALRLFALQFRHNAAYRRICESLGWTPGRVGHWTQIPSVPTAAFKDLELTCLSPEERTRVFHSSGTTQHRPSRHFHNAESLALYEASLWAWFEPHLLTPSLEERGEARGRSSPQADPAAMPGGSPDGASVAETRLLSLTPPPAQAPHSSLAHMFGALAARLGCGNSAFCGAAAPDGWRIDLPRAEAALRRSEQERTALLVLGTAFQFVELTDWLLERGVPARLPAGSRVMETGGYKGRSRELPRAELRGRISAALGVAAGRIIGEYGMSELSSQAYNLGGFAICDSRFTSSLESRGAARGPCVFHFPPWARVRIISPETGREVSDGQTGLVRVLDLANVWSVAAIQTEDLAVRHGDGLELLGRATQAEGRGCSLMTVPS